MFLLKTIEATVRLEPSELGLKTLDAVTQNLKTTYTDRVVHDVGLVVTVYDVLEIGEGTVFHSEGRVHYKVTFRAVVFCPHGSELVVGRITHMTEKGIHVSLGFFHDVFVPPELLQQPAEWKTAEQEWCWNMDEETESLYYSVNGKIRLKVHAVKFASSAEMKESTVPCMSVIGRADSTGLGMVGWEWGE